MTRAQNLPVFISFDNTPNYIEQANVLQGMAYQTIKDKTYVVVRKNFEYPIIILGPGQL